MTATDSVVKQSAKPGRAYFNLDCETCDYVTMAVASWRSCSQAITRTCYVARPEEIVAYAVVIDSKPHIVPAASVTPLRGI